MGSGVGVENGEGVDLRIESPDDKPFESIPG